MSSYKPVLSLEGHSGNNKLGKLYSGTLGNRCRKWMWGSD